MSDPTDTTIPPALSAEEWAAHREHQTVPGYDPGDPDECFRGVALSNDALYDDDPRKITREDVRDLVAIAKVHVINKLPETARVLDGIAAKLAALLPPDSH